MQTLRLTLALALLSMAGPRPAMAQDVPRRAGLRPRRDPARSPRLLSQPRAQNWDALAAYVLSPKLLERRGAPGDARMVARDRTRSRESSASAPLPACPSSASPMIDEAAIVLDGDWAEVSVPRCSGRSPGVDAFGMLYFEKRWRFIYTDLFEAQPAPETAAR